MVIAHTGQRRTSRWRGQVALLLAGVLVGTAGPVGAEVPLPPRRPVLVDRPPPAAPKADASSHLPRGRSRYLSLVEEEAQKQGMPAELADAVMRVESGYDPNVVGGVGERGLMQILPSTAAMLGFSGTRDELAEPATNIRLGVRYLAGAWRLADGDLCRALMKYRAGHRAERMSPLSVEYCRRARAHLASIGSALGGTDRLPPVTVFPTRETGTGSDSGLAVRGRRRIVIDSGRFWAAHRARVQAIQNKVRARLGGRQLAAR